MYPVKNHIEKLEYLKNIKMKADIAKQFTSKDEKSPYSLKIHTRFIILFFLIGVLLSCNRVKENPFWADGKEFFELHQIFSDERMPNIVVTASGTVLAVWGDVRRYQGDDSTYYNVRLRRS